MPLRAEVARYAETWSHSWQERDAPRCGVALSAGARRRFSSGVNVMIRDLSTTGFRMETHLVLEKGEDIWLRLPGLEAKLARVAWVAGHWVGCRFVEPIHEAVLRSVIERTIRPA